MLFLEHLVDLPAQAVGIAVSARAGIGRADDLERGNPGRGRERVGVEGALMGDLLAVRGFGDLEVEQVEDVLAAGDGSARAARRRGSLPMSSDRAGCRTRPVRRPVRRGSR